MTIENIQTTETVSNPVVIATASDEQLDALIAGDTPTADPVVETPTQDNQLETGTKLEAPEPQASEEQLMQISKDKWVSVQKALKEQKSFIGKRANELGELRKQLNQREQQIKELLEEKAGESPVQTIELQDALRAVKTKKKDIDEEQTELVTRHQIQEQFFSYVHPEDVDVADMVKALASDKLPTEFLQKFQQDPFGSGATAMELIQLARRVKAEKVLKELMTYTKGVHTKLKELESKPSKLLNNIQKTLSKPQVMSASDGGQTMNTNKRPLSPAKMTDEELDNFLNSTG